MADKKLGIELNAKDRIGRVISGVSDTVHKATNAFSDLATKGSRAIEDVTRKLFFLKEAANVVIGAIRGLANAFLKPALEARKFEQSLANVFGEGANQKIRDFSLSTGLAFNTMATASLNVSDKLKNVNGGLDAYLAAVKQVADYRPDLGAEGAVAKVDEILNKLSETTEAGEKRLGRYTSVVTGGVGQKAIDLQAELNKLGMVAKIVDPTVTAFDRLKAAWDNFAASTGGKVLDKLAEGAIKLLEKLSENEDVILELTDAVVKLINDGLDRLLEWIDAGGIEMLIESSKNWLDVLGDIWETIQPILDLVGKFTGGLFDTKKDVANPYEGGGGGVKAAGRAVGSTIFSPGQAFSQAASNLRLGVASGAGMLGNLFGGQETGAKWAKGIAGIPTAAERQATKVTVGIDPQNGNVQAYVDKQIGQANTEMINGAGGGAMVPSFGWR
jgi:hypothetical protein